MLKALEKAAGQRLAGRAPARPHPPHAPVPAGEDPGRERARGPPQERRDGLRAGDTRFPYDRPESEEALSMDMTRRRVVRTGRGCAGPGGRGRRKGRGPVGREGGGRAQGRPEDRGPEQARDGRGLDHRRGARATGGRGARRGDRQGLRDDGRGPAGRGLPRAVDPHRQPGHQRQHGARPEGALAGRRPRPRARLGVDHDRGQRRLAPVRQPPPDREARADRGVREDPRRARRRRRFRA